MPDGSWQRKELPGPPIFEYWWAYFKIYCTTLLLLDAALPEILDNCGEMVKSQSLHDDAWFVVHNADVGVRSEQVERLRWRAEQHVEVRPRQAVEDSVRDGRHGRGVVG